VLKLKVTSFFLAASLLASGPLGSFEPAASAFALVVPPVQVTFAPGAVPTDFLLETFSPDGTKHRVRDMDGRRSWAGSSEASGRIRLTPGVDNYAGPVQVVVDGKVVNRYNPLLPGSSELLIEKILVSRMPDGTALRVHYTDFSLERIGNMSFPYKVMTIASKAYQLITGEMGYSDASKSREGIDIYLGESGEKGVSAFGGFTREDFKRAPLFMLKRDAQTGAKTPAVLIPIDYGRFLSLWERINSVPYGNTSRGEARAARGTHDHDSDLAGSIMHEMTHAVLHSYHENLGSTEHCIRNGDWYTEGLARFYETKIGSDAGFASEGFRKRVGDKIQFSRGGANYFLRYPDESFFGLRYENALFWLYFEKQFGAARIVALARELRHLPFESDTRRYETALEKVTGVPFDDMLTEYFNWIYRAGYREHTESRRLLRVARTTSVWEDNSFRLKNGSRLLGERRPKLDQDWVSKWGAARANDTHESVAGDWTPEADIKPLAFDVQEIRIDGMEAPKKLLIRSTQGSSKLRATLYAGHPGGIEMVRWPSGHAMELDLSLLPQGVRTLGIVLVNLDQTQSASYEITLE